MVCDQESTGLRIQTLVTIVSLPPLLTDTAKLIEFNPLHATSVMVPPGGTFVVANSLAPMNKAANSYFNCRVMECRLAAQVMAKRAGGF